MSKKVWFLLSGGAVIISYLTVVWQLAPRHNEIFWVVLVFWGIFFVIQYVTMGKVFIRPSAREYFFRLPTIYVGIIYLVFQAVAGFFLVLFCTDLNITVLVETVIAGVYTALQFYSVGAGDNASDLGLSRKQRREGMRALETEARTMLNTAGDEEWRRLCEKLYEEVVYANPALSTDILERLEEEMKRTHEAVIQKDKRQFLICFRKIKQLLGVV